LRCIHVLFRSTRKNCGDAANEYVELKREASTCVVKGQICPEHRVQARFDAALRMTAAAFCLTLENVRYYTTF
jgi:hypothetical protein